MKFKNQEQLLDLIKKVVDQRTQEQQVAVFDADGTLWPEDANQILLDYQIEKEAQLENQSLKSNNKSPVKFSDLMSDYYQKHHRAKLCELFLTNQAGLSFAEFQDQTERALTKTPLTVFPFQRELLSYLKKQNMKIVIVTTSIQWLVELAVKKCHLPVDQVLGCRTELYQEENLDSIDSKKELVISDRLIKPSPVKDSKGEIFLKEYNKNSCLLACGNTLKDLPLLELASLPFVVHSAEKDHIIFPAEQKLKEQALLKKWLLFEA